MMVFLYAVIGLLGGAAGAALVYRFGRAFGLVDMPNERSSHTEPTPRGAGLGIAAASVAAASLQGEPLLAFALASVGGLGLVEDMAGLSIKVRLPAHLALSLLLAISALGLPETFPGLGVVIFWVVFLAGTANFYNFMDGINGMAGLMGVAAFGMLALYAYLAGAGLFALALVPIFACLGFLPFNLPRARVFMGDTGSLSLGFLFAALVMRMSAGTGSFMGMAAFLGIFYADAIITIAVRLVKGDNIFMAHRGHLYQYISNELGVAHWKVSLGYASAQAALGAAALLSLPGGGALRLAAAFALLAAVVYKSIKCLPSKGRAIQKTEGNL